ncbi:MAG: S8 family serine peptidase [Nodosilinea sp. WJT8-NPBG4]|jgi:hypothetical protein|nr:S8 family serine peptidase [Nodosilinea sp. WJT8-NPBG4]
MSQQNFAQSAGTDLQSSASKSLRNAQAVSLASQFQPQRHQGLDTNRLTSALPTQNSLASPQVMRLEDAFAAAVNPTQPTLTQSLQKLAPGWLRQGIQELQQRFGNGHEAAVSPLPQSQGPLIGIIDTGFAPGQHGNQMLKTIQNGNPEATILLADSVGKGTWADSLTQFVDTAKATGQTRAVVNASFDLTQKNPDGSITTRQELTAQEKAALNYARENGVLVVASAGNEGKAMSALGQASGLSDNLIVVGSAEGNDRASYSSYGNGLDLVTDVGAAGTSLAAAKVTGAIANIWSANPELSGQQVNQILTATATDLKTPGRDTETGAGLLNSTAAINLAKMITPETRQFSGAQLIQQVNGSFNNTPWISTDGTVASERTNREFEDKYIPEGERLRAGSIPAAERRLKTQRANSPAGSIPAAERRLKTQRANSPAGSIPAAERRLKTQRANSPAGSIPAAERRLKTQRANSPAGSIPAAERRLETQRANSPAGSIPAAERQLETQRANGPAGSIPAAERQLETQRANGPAGSMTAAEHRLKTQLEQKAALNQKMHDPDASTFERNEASKILHEQEAEELAMVNDQRNAHEIAALLQKAYSPDLSPTDLNGWSGTIQEQQKAGQRRAHEITALLQKAYDPDISDVERNKARETLQKQKFLSLVKTANDPYVSIPERIKAQEMLNRPGVRQRDITANEVKAAAGSDNGMTREDLHTFLDVVGTFEPTPFADLTNAILYASEGDWTNAGISAGSVLPYAGDAAFKGGKYGYKIYEGLRGTGKAEHGAKGVSPDSPPANPAGAGSPNSGLPSNAQPPQNSGAGAPTVTPPDAVLPPGTPVKPPANSPGGRDIPGAGRGGSPITNGGPNKGKPGPRDTRPAGRGDAPGPKKRGAGGGRRYGRGSGLSGKPKDTSPSGSGGHPTNQPDREPALVGGRAHEGTGDSGINDNPPRGDGKHDPDPLEGGSPNQPNKGQQPDPPDTVTSPQANANHNPAAPGAGGSGSPSPASMPPRRPPSPASMPPKRPPGGPNPPTGGTGGPGGPNGPRPSTGGGSSGPLSMSPADLAKQERNLQFALNKFGDRVDLGESLPVALKLEKKDWKHILQGHVDETFDPRVRVDKPKSTVFKGTADEYLNILKRALDNPKVRGAIDEAKRQGLTSVNIKNIKPGGKKISDQPFTLEIDLLEKKIKTFHPTGNPGPNFRQR